MTDPAPLRQAARAILDAAIAAGNARRLTHEALERLDLGRFRRVVVVGGGKASGAMALAVEDVLGDRVTAGLVAVKEAATGADAADPRGRSRTSAPRRARADGGRGDRAAGGDGGARRPRALPRLGRGLGAPAGAGHGGDPRREAGGDAPPAGGRRDDQRAERGAQAPLAAQGGPARPRGSAGAGRGAAPLGRPRRPARRDRLGPHGARSHDLHRRPRGARRLRAAGPCSRVGAPSPGSGRGGTVAETPKPGDPSSSA